MGREKHAEQAYREQMEKTEENGRPLHATEVSTGVVSIFAEYVEREKMKEYLVDGAILKCSNSTLLPFQVKNKMGITLINIKNKSEEEKEERERTRLYVRNADGKMEVEKSHYATVLDCKKGELSKQSVEEDNSEGPNIYPFRCNCKMGVDKAIEEIMIKTHIEECRENGVCQYLMELNDTWENWPSEQRRFYEKRLVKVPIETEDGMKEFSVDAECISMTSMLFCKHGGLITPVKSGQVTFENGLVTRTTLKSVGFLEISDESIYKLNTMLYLYDISSIKEIRHLLAQCVVESGGGKYLTEVNWKKGQYPDDVSYFNNKYKGKIGNTEEGDGYRFRGAGYLHLSGRDNYQLFAEYLQDQGRTDERIMSEGADIIKLDYAWESAIWYWKNIGNKQGLNGTELVESNATVRDITHYINGGENGLAEREAAYANFVWEE